MVYWFGYAYTHTDSHTYCVPIVRINVTLYGLFLHCAGYDGSHLPAWLKYIKELTTEKRPTATAGSLPYVCAKYKTATHEAKPAKVVQDHTKSIFVGAG